MEPKTITPATDGMGIGPRDVAPPAPGPDDAERDGRIRELFLEAHGAEVIAFIENGSCGPEIRKQWRRHRTNSEKFWPATEKRKARI